MTNNVSPYLLTPCRDLPTACRQIREAQGLRSKPCGACAIAGLCKAAIHRELQAIAQLPEAIAKQTGQAIIRPIIRVPRRTEAA